MKRFVARKAHIPTGKSFAQLRLEMLMDFLANHKLGDQIGLDMHFSGDLKPSGKRMVKLLTARGLMKITDTKDINNQPAFYYEAL